MAHIIRIDWHISNNQWADGCDMEGIDEAESFDAYLDALETALKLDYPEASVRIWSQDGELGNDLVIRYDSTESDWRDSDHDRANLMMIGTDVWERGDFWRFTPELIDELALAPLL